MALPDSYLRYARRRYGMDHTRYAWSELSKRKPVSWPGGARVALWVVPALEFFPLDQKAEPFRVPGGMVTPYPDLRHYTLRDYGNRVGIFRIMSVLDKLGITASVAVNAAVAERYPFLINEVNRRGWEILAHGVDMGHLHYGGMAIEEEKAQIEHAVTSLRKISGQPIKGWLSPAKSESENTLDLIADFGIEYVCDWINDDMPYPMETAHGTIHSLPHSHEISDLTILLNNHHSDAEFAEQIGDQFDVLYREAGAQGGRIVAITLHPWMTGQPHRIKSLERMLAAIMDHDGVWSATGWEILSAFREQE